MLVRSLMRGAWAADLLKEKCLGIVPCAAALFLKFDA
jgi:hypothetical protein